MLVRVFSDQEEDDLQPVGVQEFLLLLLVQADDPPSSVLVPKINQ